MNDILIQHFEEVSVRRLGKPQPLNDRFELVDNTMRARNDDVFDSHPSALLEMFVIMAQRNDIVGVRAAPFGWCATVST